MRHLDDPELQQAFEWRTALDDWRAGFAGTLAGKLRSESPPQFVRLALADFLDGTGPKPARRGKGRAKFAPSAKRETAREWMLFLGTLALGRAESERFASRHGIEPADLIERLADDRAESLRIVSQEFGVAPATIEAEAKRVRRMRRETKPV